MGRLGQFEPAASSVQLPGGTSISFSNNGQLSYAVPGTTTAPALETPFTPQWWAEPNGLFPAASNLAVLSIAGFSALLLFASRRRLA
jgi:hypothetical protein